MAVPAFEELQLLHRTMCQAVGDPKRIQIIYALAEEPLHVNALAAALATPQPTISRHLSILKQCGLVEATRNGQLVIYQLTSPKVIDVINEMRRLLRDSLERQSNQLDFVKETPVHR